MGGAGQAWRSWLPIMVLVVLAFGLRASTLLQGTNVDEGDYILQGREMVLGHWPHADVHLNKPPLVSFIAYPFFWFSGNPILPVRVFMILLSASAVFAVYWLGRRVHSSAMGMCAAVFVAFDPMSAIWAKALHVSTLTPILAIWTLTLLVEGFVSGKRYWLVASGVVFSLALMNKQTGIVLFPVLLLFLLSAWMGWLRFEEEKPIRISFRDAVYWFASVLPVWLLFLLYLLALNAVEPFIYDIWTSNLRMAGAFDQDAAHRWGEFQAMMFWNPWVWWIALGGCMLALIRFRMPAGLLLVLWLVIEFYVNLFALSHYWTHYTMAITVPAAMLAGLLFAEIKRWVEKALPVSSIVMHAGVVAVCVLLVMSYWQRANWAYPNLTLEDERGLAAFVDRQFDSKYLLCFANTTFYIWTDSQVPPSLRDGREVRIPPFMNTAARGYLSLDDMQATADLWRTLPIGYCIMYGKYYRQIFEEQDPLLEPIRLYLEEHFEFEQRFVYRPTYMAELFCFRAKSQEN